MFVDALVVFAGLFAIGVLVGILAAHLGKKLERVSQLVFYINQHDLMTLGEMGIGIPGNWVEKKP